MRMRFVETRGISNPKETRIRVRGAIFLCLSLLILSQAGIPQEPVSAQSSQTSELPNVPYLGDKGSMELLRTAPAGFISHISTAAEEDALVVRVASSCELTYQEFRLNNPERLVVDLLNAENRTAALNYRIGSAGVRQLRVRQFQSSDPKIARLVFDLDSGYKSHEVASAPDSLRIVFHGDTRIDTPAPQPPEEKVGDVDSEPQPAPAGSPQDLPPAVDAKQKTPVPPVRPVISDLSMSEIPKSALAAAASQPTVRVQPPAPRIEETPPPPPNTPAIPSQPVMRLNPQAGRYAGHPLTLDLVNISLVDFFRLMAEEGGINIVMDPDIKGMLSIKVEKVPWDQICEAALVNNSLEKQVEGNLVRIATKKTIQAEAKQLEDLKKATLLAADVETRIRRLNYAKADNLMDAIKDQLTVRGTIVVNDRTSSLVITDVPNSLDKIMPIIDQLDTPEPQVEIEARIVSATRDFARDIGVQFGFVEGNLDRVTVGGPNTFGTIGGSRPSATPTNTYAAGNSTTGRGTSTSSSTQSGGTSTGPNSTNNPGNFNVNLPSQKPFGGLGLSVGNIFDTFLLDAAITAGETQGQAKLISQPKLTTQNNNPGTITQGLRFPVQVIANNTVTVQFQNAALTLTVTPQITSEGNIVLDLKVENNTPDFGHQVMGIPSIRTSESNTRVLVSDGGTTVIGGILIDNEETQDDRVPGLASLPIFGNLFKRSVVSHNTQEVLFFVTPRIVK
jgi:type IV pilus secretin PilQ/predicted competence protein